MKLISVVSSLIIFGAAAVAQTAPQSQNRALTQELMAKSKSVYQAINAKNVAAVNSLVADDFHFVYSDGHVYGKREMLGAAQEGGLPEPMFYNAEAMPVDSDSAILIYNIIVNLPEGDNGLAPRYQKISDLWVRHGGDWQLKFEQSTPLRSID